ncbi:response regulator [Salinimicrobium oceani]|uniref:Response regulator n=1 Tax=Salinimicrobium oceani TaxID=2722702 RepID=A0ABX1CVP9_9FLAO|nr:response regulator [Salinimicrobium oceani]NJW52353.1 response regulator [Salinimicrobium oceani]
MNLDVVIVDDDAVVLFLHKVLIKKSPLPSAIHDFRSAKEALPFVVERSKTQKLLIFLDINMPEINGWDFLEQLEQRVASKKIFVVMVTSSINWSDRNRAGKYSLVIDYREKPLSKQACEEVYIKLLNRLNS